MTNGGATVGVDIGGTKTRMAWLDGRDLREFYHEPTPDDPERALRDVVDAVRSLELPAPLGRIGIGCPGPLDPDAGVVRSPPNLPAWRDVPVVERLQDELGVPVRLENDANAGALGEALHGSAQGFRWVFYLTISTGIGAGIVIDGRIHRGFRGLAGEVWSFVPAHFGVESDLTVTELASGAGMTEQVRRALASGRESVIPVDEVSTRSILEASKEGDPLAVETMDRARRTLAGTLCFVLPLLAPDIIVLGGGLCTDPDWFVEPLREAVRSRLRIRSFADVPIRRAELWDRAVLYGAVSL
jgi:glucokinase